MVFCKTLRRTIHILVGIIIGFLLTSEFRSLNYENFKRDIIFQLCSYQNVRPNIASQSSFESVNDFERTFSLIHNLTHSHESTGKRKLLLVGVMTAKQFIDSRALTIYKTWAKDLDGHVIFFSSENTRPTEDLPLVALPGVDDSYPPQKKSFLMFKFMHDFFGDKYNFFMRADDDVFVNIQRMNSFLRKLNSSNNIFIGQTGVGNKDEFGQLNLNLNENFCMGGPGIIMSHVTLSYLSTNIEKCLKKLYSTHEDVEIGRCVKKYAGVSCTWSYDMQNLFYHNSSLQNLINNNIYPTKELFKAITIHPIKDPIAMINLYLHFQTIEHQEMRYKLTKANQILNFNLNYVNNLNALANLLNFSDILQLQSFLNKTKQLGLEISLNSLYSSKNTYSMTTWNFFAQKLYSELSINPKRHIEQHILKAFNTNIQRLMATINQQSFRKSRILDYHSLYYGYVKFDYKFGVQYILDLLMIYRKYQGKRMTIPIRRHAYVIQTFSKTQLKQQMYAEDINKQLVNVIVPLSGRFSIFKRFIVNFAQVCRNDSFVGLTVVLFPESNHSDDLNMTKQTLNNFANQYHVKMNIFEINGTFSRGIALQKSIALFNNDSLLFFLDVDINFTSEVLYRVRRNTRMYEQVYFPIVFSQYSNKMSNHSNANEILSINDLDGYWRQFGFGIVSLYKHDLLFVGGYDVNINGWGMEDVSLYDRFVSSNLTIFRTIDPGLIHIYHDIHCDNRLPPVQFEMCLGTKLSSLDSIKELSLYANLNNLLRV